MCISSFLFLVSYFSSTSILCMYKLKLSLSNFWVRATHSDDQFFSLNQYYYLKNWFGGWVDGKLTLLALIFGLYLLVFLGGF